MSLRLRSEVAHDSKEIPQILSPLIMKSFSFWTLNLPPISCLFTLDFMCSYSLFMIIFTGRPLHVLILPMTFCDLPSVSRSWPVERCWRFHRASQEGWQRFTEQPVKMLMLNVQMFRSKVTLKGKRVWAQAEVMRWRGHADALSSPQIKKQTTEIRMLSIFWPWML